MTEPLETLTTGSTLGLVPISSIRRDRNIRANVGDLTELKNSIKEVGLLEPVLVSPLENPEDGVEYELDDGYRRTEVMDLLGFETIEARIMSRPLTEQERLVLALTANLHSKSLSPMDEARAFAELQELDMTILAIAEHVSKTANYVQNRAALLDYSKEIQEGVEAGILTVSHAKEISRVDPAHHQILINKVEKELPVSKLRKIVDKYLSDLQKKKVSDVVGGNEPEPDLAAEAILKAEKAMRQSLRDDLVRISRAFNPRSEHEIERIDFGKLPTEAVRTLNILMAQVPTDADDLRANAQRIADGAQSEHVAVDEAQDQDMTLSFWGGPDNASAEAFDLLMSRIPEEEDRVAAVKRIKYYAEERHNGPGAKVQKRDIDMVASELNISMEGTQ